MKTITTFTIALITFVTLCGSARAQAQKAAAPVKVDPQTISGLGAHIGSQR
jgi:hypothetical protein